MQFISSINIANQNTAIRKNQAVHVNYLNKDLINLHKGYDVDTTVELDSASGPHNSSEFYRVLSSSLFANIGLWRHLLDNFI